MEMNTDEQAKVCGQRAYYRIIDEVFDHKSPFNASEEKAIIKILSELSNSSFEFGANLQKLQPFLVRR